MMIPASQARKYKVDYEGLEKFLIDCNQCNLREKKENGTICPHYLGHNKKHCGKLRFGCPPAAGEESRLAVTESVGKLFNVPNPKDHGAHHMFFYVYYQQFNCCFPDKPDFDIDGNVNASSILAEAIEEKMHKHFTWIIHHINGNHWDNRKENLALVLNTEHGRLHGGTLEGEDLEEYIQKIKDRNRKLFGISCWGGEE